MLAPGLARRSSDSIPGEGIMRGVDRARAAAARRDIVDER
jgi:hypothetical protein